jgi:hypothetical protein
MVLISLFIAIVENNLSSNTCNISFLSSWDKHIYKNKPCGDNGSLVWGGSEPRAAP